MGSVAPFLIWLLCIGIAAIMLGLFIQDFEKEGFANERPSGISITTCPAGSTTYITAAGNTNCCNGDIVSNKCNGTEICTLSPSGQGLQTCAEWISKEWVSRSRKFCAGTMPHYFGNLERTPGLEGCSASLCTPDGSLPQDETQPKCKIYGSLTDELSKVDSCYNINALEQITCPQADAKRLMNSYGTDLPVIFNCSYIPRDGSNNGMPTSCFDAARAITYIQNISYMNAEQKDSFINDINARKVSHFCNYVKPTGTGWTMTVPGGAKVPVQKIGLMAGETTYTAQNGDKIIFFKPGANGSKHVATLTGKLSDYDLSADNWVGPIFQALGSTYANVNTDGYSILKD
jgi:hypothetical protein